MRIAWFHSHFMHVNSGGTRFVLDYSYALQHNHGHQVTLFCDIASSEVATQLEQCGMKLVQLDRESTNSPGYWLTLPGRIRRKTAELEPVLRDYDFIINSMFPMNWLVCDFKLPKLQICYEPFAFFYDKGFLQNFKFHHRMFFRVMKLLYSGKDKAAVRKMDKVLTINKTNVPKLFEEYGINVTPLYAGIDTELYKRAPASDVAELRKKHSGFPLLFHSTDLTGIKGSYPLLEVINELRGSYPEVKLLFTVYVNDPVGTEKFLKRISELGLQKNVEFLGCLPKEKLPLYYSAVDFVCQPSINQPANWPLKESLLCGTPIIAGIESEEVKDFVNGCQIEVRNKNASAVKLCDLMARRSELNLEESVTELLRDFSRNSCVAQLNRMIEEMHENCKNR
ncbi:MAG: glycosyltransferase family 4 protein [Victivallaceae bacterium]